LSRYLTTYLPPPCRVTASQFADAVIPDELRFAGRDPWFDRLTTLSEVEGESSESDELRHSLRGERESESSYCLNYIENK